MSKFVLNSLKKVKTHRISYSLKYKYIYIRKETSEKIKTKKVNFYIIVI